MTINYDDLAPKIDPATLDTTPINDALLQRIAKLERSGSFQSPLELSRHLKIPVQKLEMIRRLPNYLDILRSEVPMTSSAYMPILNRDDVTNAFNDQIAASLRALIEIRDDKDVKPEVRLRAAKEILDRAPDVLTTTAASTPDIKIVLGADQLKSIQETFESDEEVLNLIDGLDYDEIK